MTKPTSMHIISEDQYTELVPEPQPHKFNFIASVTTKILMEITADKVFLYVANLALSFQTLGLLFLTIINVVLFFFDVIDVNQLVVVQGIFTLFYLVFVKSKPAYYKIAVPDQWTNYFRNKLRDDSKAVPKTLTYQMTVDQWNGVQEIPRKHQPVMQLSPEVSKRIKNHFKEQLISSPQTPEPVIDLEGFAQEQKEKSDPYSSA